MNDGTNFCVCRRLLDLGVVDALENAPKRDDIFIAIQACLDRNICGYQEPPAAAPDGAASRRKRSDRRSGIDRRQNNQAWPAENERRTGKERRSGGDRRGLLAGEQYTPQEAFLNLKAWCNGHCRHPFDLSLDKKSGQLRFHFDDPQDRAGFTDMLKKFKGLSAPPKGS